MLQALTGLQFQMKEQLREREETSTQPGSQGSAYIVPHAIFIYTNVSKTFPSKARSFFKSIIIFSQCIYLYAHIGIISK